MKCPSHSCNRHALGSIYETVRRLTEKHDGKCEHSNVTKNLFYAEHDFVEPSNLTEIQFKIKK